MHCTPTSISGLMQVDIPLLYSFPFARHLPSAAPGPESPILLHLFAVLKTSSLKRDIMSNSQRTLYNLSQLQEHGGGLSDGGTDTTSLLGGVAEPLIG